MPGWGPLCGKEWHPEREPPYGEGPFATIILPIGVVLVVLAVAVLVL